MDSTDRDGSGRPAVLSGRRSSLIVIALVAAVFVPLIVALWPSSPEGLLGDYRGATLDEVAFGDCEVTDEVACGEARATLDSGEQVEVLLYRDEMLAGVETGQSVILLESVGPSGETAYGLHSRDRSVPLILMSAGLLVAVGCIVGGRGVRALISLAAAGVFIFTFLLPGLATGGSPVLYTGITAVVVLTCVLFFTHGLSAKTLAAWCATTISVGVSLGLGSWASASMGLTAATGDVSELRRLLPEVDLAALSVAGLILVLIGVLNDIAAAQAATVFAHGDELDEDASARRRVWSSSLSVGRDHAASAIYTVTFSAVGAGLTGFVLTTALGVPASAMLQSDEVALLLVQTAAGIAGVIVAMPLTTFIAMAAHRVLAEEVPATAHTH